MSDMWINCFSFVFVTSRQSIFQNCLEILSAAASHDVSKSLELLFILHLALFYYLSTIIGDQTCYSMGRHDGTGRESYWSNQYLAIISKQSVCHARHQVIQIIWAMFAICLGIVFLTEQDTLSYCFIGLALVGTN